MLFGSLLLPRAGGGGGGGVSGTTFVALSSVSSGNAAYSADGITWATALMPIAAPFVGCAWNGNVFCAIGAGIPAYNSASGNGTASFVAATSADGNIWTARTMPSNNQWDSISWSPAAQLFVAVAADLIGSCATSPDGVTWTLRAGIYPARGNSFVMWANFTSILNS